MRRRLILTICFAVTLIVSHAWGQADFSQMVTFGDSLTHNDLLTIYSGNPQDMYGADPFEAVFNKGNPGNGELSNYAVAGSESGDLTFQLSLYEFNLSLGSQEPATLIGFEIGGNDIRSNIDLLAQYVPGENPGADSVISDLISNTREALLWLWFQHPGAQFIIWTLPDITLAPDHWNLTAAERSNVRRHIQRVNRQIRQAGQIPTVTVLDTFFLIRTAVNNPFVIFGTPLIGPPAHGGYDHLFADQIHPSAVSNAIFGSIMIFQINQKWGDSISAYSEEELADLAHIPH